MKQRSTTPVSKHIIRRVALTTIAGLMVVTVPFSFSPKVSADKYDDQINALQKEIDQYQAKAGDLNKQILSLQEEIKGIDSQKSLIQTQISLTEVKLAKLQQDIADTEKRISDNRTALGTTLADLYVDDTISPLEMLASSKSIADYVDKQEYRNVIRDQLSVTIETIKKLKADLEAQKTDVQRTLADQTNAKNALVAKEAERNTLLAKTQGQENAYRQLSSDREAQKLKVQQQQQAAIEAAIAAAGGGGAVVLPGTSGGYPWNSSNCYVDSNALSHGGVDGNGGDGMGYGCRQCASYVAWRILKETGYAPTYWGDAIDFVSSGRAAGFTVSSTPRERSAGVITTGGRPGHVVWVESIDKNNGTMIVSQYNYYNAGGPGWGNYSKMQVPIGTYQQYVYF
ncbi:MAG TPA: CHAP domain-containing protein [Candidatus Saccharimonadales bacterium]|nr:CHAP domain-containing protein [Candidatus Saccharimonadales bacterium]